MSKTDYNITRQLQEDVIAAYIKVSGKAWDYQDAFRQIASMPAPRYYVTAKQAFQIVAPMMKGDFRKVDHMTRNKRRMYYSLFNKAMELSEQHTFRGKSLFYIMQFAVTSPAPEFFLSPNRINNIRHFYRTGVTDDDGRMVKPWCETERYKRVKAERQRRKEEAIV